MTWRGEGAGGALALDCVEQLLLGMAVEATALHPPAWAPLVLLMSEPPSRQMENAVSPFSEE